MDDVFLSYARADQVRAKLLVDALRHEGLSVWWDPKILPGDNWRSTIGRALGNAKCAIVLWTRTSVESRWVQEEAEDAEQRGVLFPVLIDQVPPPIGFRGVQCANLVGWTGLAANEEVQNLVSAIRARIVELDKAAEERKAASAAAAGAGTATSAETVKTAVTHPSEAVPVSPAEGSSPAGPSKTGAKVPRKWFVVGALAAAAVASGWFVITSRSQMMLNPNDGLNYRRIPAGKFFMGCDFECEDDELPRHYVTISQDFWITETEVTAAAYARFAEATHRSMPPQPPSACGNPAEFNPKWTLGNHPIVDVSYFDGRDYCQWAGNGAGDLPTEAQWEYAARGKTTDRKFPWGNVLTPNDANYGEPELYDGDPKRVKDPHYRDPRPGDRDQWRYTSPVRSFAPNAYGLYDMVGNVQEWCRDVYRPYSDSELKDPDVQGGKDEERVVRGGSFVYGAQDCRLWNRSKNPPSGRFTDSGFRCVLPVR